MTALDSADSSEVQIWRAPPSITTLATPIRLQLWLAPASSSDGGFATVTAGLFDCTSTGGDYVALADDVGVFSPVLGVFTGVSFDLTPTGGTYAVPAGRVIEVRVACPDGSATDVLVAYDATQYPASLTLGQDM